MARRSVAAISCAALAITGVFSACDNKEVGEPTASTGQTSAPATSSPVTTSTPPPSLPFSGAPKVADPIDVPEFVREPCAVLSVDQVDRLKVGKGVQREGNRGLVCDWSSINSTGNIDLQFIADSHEGLSSIYRANDAGNYTRFDPIGEIEGFPAVIVSLQGEVSKGDCIIDVGVSDELIFQLGVTESDEKVGKIDPCDVTKAVAQEMLQTMKAGA